MIFLSFFLECETQCSEEQPSPMEVVQQPHVLAIGSLVPVQKSSPERRNQKEIVAGEERPKFLTIKQTEDAQGRFISFHSKLIIYHRQRSTSYRTHLKNFQISLLMQIKKIRHFFSLSLTLIVLWNCSASFAPIFFPLFFHNSSQYRWSSWITLTHACTDKNHKFIKNHK